MNEAIEKIKGYKAMLVDADGRLFCMPDGEKTLQFYEIGKTYKMKDYEVIFCRSGFHFCPNLKDCYDYYPLSDLTAICEIEASGKIESNMHKSVCSEITILKRLSEEEIKKVAGKLIIKSSFIKESAFIDRSDCVYQSEYVKNSRLIFKSDDVEFGENINHSKFIYGGTNVWHSHNILHSQNIDFGDFIIQSANTNLSKYINHSVNITNCIGVRTSHNIDNSNAVNSSNNIVGSHYISNCMNLVDCLFCCDLRNKHYYIFNEKSTKQRAKKIKDDLLKIEKRFYPKFVCLNDRNHLQEQDIYKAYKELYKNKEEYKEFLDYIRNMPEFDNKIFKRICGRYE